MGSPRVTPDQKRRFAARLKDGWTIADSATFAEVSYPWAKAYARGLRNSSGRAWKGEDEQAHDELPGPIARDQLKPEALRALEDFGYFRFRYLGRISTPWQEEAGHRVVEWLSTSRKEFVVENAPPGSGKSTLHTLDIPLWLTCRNRALRGLIGSASQTLADAYLFRIANHLTMVEPVQAEDDDMQLGLAVDAEATLLGDFGVFRTPGGLWSAKKIVVAQHEGRLLSQKEATWTSWGLWTNFIGGRYGVNLWDDSVDEADFLTLESTEKVQRRWDKVAEKRCEPAGLVLLQGQRLTPEDLYKHNIGKMAGESDRHDHDCCDAEPGRKYHLVKYRAHDETKCIDEHTEAAPYWPQGCLLDPRRLPWRELEAEQANDLGTYLQVYQQEDSDPSKQLIHPLWIKGGTDPETREWFPGCWDNDRGLAEVPAGVGHTLSIASTDPSPTKYWGNQWWCVETDGANRRFLMDLYRKSMMVTEFLSRRDGRWSGLAEDWWQMSKDIERPITHWIWEQNAAQRFFTDMDDAKDWARARGVTWVKHQTTANRTDPKFGPQRLQSVYKLGLVRLPGFGGAARTTSLKLIEEVEAWPRGSYDDQVMSQTFVELRLGGLLKSSLREHNVVSLDRRRPTWAA